MSSSTVSGTGRTEAATLGPVTDDLVMRLARHVVCGPDPQIVELTTPMTGRPLARMVRSAVTDVDAAFAAGRVAQRRWGRTTLRERSGILLRFHDLVLQHQVELLDLVQLESGKARAHAFDEVAHTALVARHYARKLPSYLAGYSRSGALLGMTTSRTHRHPKGVVGVVAPWNYPLSMSITDALAALAAGNAVVLRPDDRSALTALYAVDLLERAGLPEGVLQVVLGDGATIGQAVVDRGDYVCFTGSTAVGRTVAATCAERLVGCSLELGGKNPMYVAADADLERTARGALVACFSSAGQLCVSMERLYVHDAVHDEFVALLVEKVQAMRLGTALEYGYDMGSLAGPRELQKVTEHVEDARAKGATVLTGGRARPDLGPYVYEPTLLAGVTPDMRVHREETFGPVVAVYRVKNDAAAVLAMNDCELGLNASIWSGHTRRAARIATRVQAGTVGINDGYQAAWSTPGAPMGGMKDSGLGRRHGAEGIRRFTEEQTVVTQRLVPVSGPPQLGQERWSQALALGLKALKAGHLA